MTACGQANALRIPASAMKPGAVIGEPDTGRRILVTTEDAVERGRIAGFNEKRVGQSRLLIPRLSREDYLNLALTRLPEAEGELEAKLRMLHTVSADVRDRFVATRKAVKQQTSEGERVIIVPRVPEAADEEEIAEAEVGGVPEIQFAPLTDEELLARPKQRTYQLSQIFNDLSVIEKFDLPDRIVECGKRTAASDAKAAAFLFQDAMNSIQSEINVKVRAGAFNRDRVQAANTIKMMAKGCRMTSASVVSDVIGGELFMYGPGGIDDWHVRGPLKHAEVLCSLYWLVSAEGPIVPSWLLGMECVLLRMEIYDGRTYEEPSLTFHALRVGDSAPPAVMASETLAVLSTTQRSELGRVRSRLVPVTFKSEQLATAVRVTGKHVLVNAHVTDGNPLCEVDGRRVMINSQVSRDLNAVLSEGDAEPWSLRTPLVGELAAIFYVAGGKLGVSRPIEVTSVDSVTVVTTLDPDVSHGMSGGALVALSDMSLLGVHSAATRMSLLAYRFSAENFSSLLEMDGVTVVSRQSDPDTFAGKVFAQFRKRGLGGILAKAISSMTPVYMAGTHVGMAVKNGDKLVTTCDAQMPLRYGHEQIPLVAEIEIPNAVYTVPDRVGVLNAPVLRRKPRHFEQVFIVGYSDDAYISVETRVVHIAPNSRSFVVSALPDSSSPLLGGLVMAWDGAVLGQCGVESASTAVGLGMMCWPLKEMEMVTVEQPREVLQRAFPFLNMACWSDELLEEVFTHSSVGKYKDGRIFNVGNKPLANVGDNIAKAELYKTMRDLAVPHSTWSIKMQAKQNNQVFGVLAWKHGYAQLYRFGPGAQIPKDSKAYADLTEALIGAAYLVENGDVVSLLCRALGIVYLGYDDASETLASMSLD